MARIASASITTATVLIAILASSSSTQAAKCPVFQQVTAANKAACTSVAGCRVSDFYPYCTEAAPPAVVPAPAPVVTTAKPTPVPTVCPPFDYVNDYNIIACAALGCQWQDVSPHCVPKH